MSLLNFGKKTGGRVSPPKQYPAMLQKWVDLIQMWDDVYDEYRSRYNPERALSTNRKLYLDSNFTYSMNTHVSAYYVIDEMPPEMELGYRKTMRSVAPEGVSINFIESNEPFELNWDDPRFKSRMRVKSEVTTSSQEEQADTNVYNSFKYARGNQEDERTEMSIEYARDATMSDQNQRSLYKVRVLVVITGVRGEDFSNTLKDFERMCEYRTGLKVRRITGDITATVQAFSPFNAMMTKQDRKKLRYTFTSDELRAQWHPFEQGIVGYGTTYLGTNIFTNSPVFNQFKRDVTDAETVIILGMAGSGKSYLMKLLSVQLGANDNMIMTINDYEGGEYKQLGELVAEDNKVVSLDLGMGSGRYLDPVQLVPTHDEEMDITLFTRARKNVIDLFRAVAGTKSLADHPWISVIIERGVDMFYHDLRVTQDTSTWSATLGKNIYDVYGYLKQYRPGSSELSSTVTEADKGILTDEDVRELYKQALLNFQQDRIYFLETFGAYFEQDKKINNYFTKPIYLKDIIDAKLVICDYNMRGVPESQLSELDALLIPLNASTVAYYRTVYPFSRGLYNVKVWEELQRFSSLPNAVELLKTPITGGRKSGDINIVASNDPAKLIERDEYSLFSNYTMALVGKIKSPTIQESVCRTLGIMDLADELAEIGAVVEEEDGINTGYDEVFAEPYKKAFVLKLNSGESAVIKANIPKHLSETPLFKTGIVLRDRDSA